MVSGAAWFFHLVCDPVSFLIYVGIFKDCHAKIAPENFLENCVYDVCHTGETVSLCNGLQAYAESCSNAGICREWRNQTFCRESCHLYLLMSAMQKIELTVTCDCMGFLCRSLEKGFPLCPCSKTSARSSHHVQTFLTTLCFSGTNRGSWKRIVLGSFPFSDRGFSHHL